MGELSILETVVYVSDLEAAESFYGEVLGLSVLSKQVGRHVFFRCGDAMFLVFNPEATAVKLGEVPSHGAVGPGHVAFSINGTEWPLWVERLAEYGIGVEASIEWPGGGRSIYLRDPGGNSVELATPAIWGIGLRRGGGS
jgi:catechol 2,3-dioxygenase-like lactoylglutathione lyase family enzyme